MKLPFKYTYVWKSTLEDIFIKRRNLPPPSLFIELIIEVMDEVKMSKLWVSPKL